MHGCPQGLFFFLRGLLAVGMSSSDDHPHARDTVVTVGEGHQQQQQLSSDTDLIRGTGRSGILLHTSSNSDSDSDGSDSEESHVTSHAAAPAAAKTLPTRTLSRARHRSKRLAALWRASMSDSEDEHHQADADGDAEGKGSDDAIVAPQHHSATLSVGSSDRSEVPWEAAGEEQLRTWMHTAQVYSAVNEEAAIAFYRYNRVAKAILAVLSVMVGAKGLQSISIGQAWWDVAGGVCELLMLAFTGVVVSVDWGARAVSHQKRANGYARIVTTIVGQLALPVQHRTPMRVLLEAVPQRRAQLEELAEPLPASLRLRAEKSLAAAGSGHQYWWIAGGGKGFANNSSSSTSSPGGGRVTSAVGAASGEQQRRHRHRRRAAKDAPPQHPRHTQTAPPQPAHKRNPVVAYRRDWNQEGNVAWISAAQVL